VCYDKIVERLAEFRCDWSQFYELASRESGINEFSMAEIEEMPLHDKIKAIEKMVGQENFFFPQDVHNMYGLRILEKRSLTTLLTRLIWSDHVVVVSLPALLSYRRKAVIFAPTDSREQIRAVLRDEPRLPPTLIQGDPPLVDVEADHLLRSVQSEYWRMMLCFSDPSRFTKEFIERQEKEEAEREAKREARP